MKKKISTIILVSLLSVFMVGANEPGKIAIARIYEGQSVDFSRIVLVFENGETEITPLKNLPYLGSLKVSNERFVENQITINKMFNDMALKGYEIDKLSVSGESFLYTFVVFKRVKEVEKEEVQEIVE